MGIPIDYPGLTPQMVKLIKNRAYHLCTRYGYTPCDRDDLEQDMALHLLAALPRYDPKKSNPQTYADRVIDKWTAATIRGRRAECRDYAAVESSLDEAWADDADWLMGTRDTVGDMVSADDSAAPTDFADQIDTRLDIQRVIERLPPELTQMCVALETMSLTEYGIVSGIPRTTLSSRMKRLRRAFVSQGFGKEK